jgi:hypothetical protein
VRRSRRLALSAACAAAAFAVAGRLAGDAGSRVDAADRGSAASASPASASQAAEAVASPARVTSPQGDATSGLAADTAGPAPARLEAVRAVATHARSAGSAAPIVLDDPQAALGSAVAIHGRDPAGPRAIELWRIVGSRSARIATGRSREDGTLDLPALVLPAGEVTLVASPRGAGPDAAAASQAVQASRDPSPPHLVAREESVDASGAASLSLHLAPAESGGEIVVLRVGDAIDAGEALQVEALRVPVVAAADATRATLDLVIALEAGDTEVRVAQELVDGRRSPWRIVQLEPRNQENEDAVAVIDVVQP